MPDDQRYTAKDAKNLAGLSYRQLNDWESRGAMPNERAGERTWRKFSPKQIFALMVCGEIRQRYGIPVEKIRFVRDFMMKDDERNHLSAAIRLMQLGLHVFLLTDLEETFVMDSDLEFTDLMRHGYFRVEEPPRPYIFLRLNPIVNRLLGALKDPIELKAHSFEGAYRTRAEVDAATSIKNLPELDLLQAARSGKFDQISVKMKNGEIREISSEGDLPEQAIREKAGNVHVQSDSSFETFTVTKSDGKIVRARRKIPKKYTSKDNRPVLVVGIHAGDSEEREGKAE